MAHSFARLLLGRVSFETPSATFADRTMQGKCTAGADGPQEDGRISGNFEHFS
jgi:hypothetical protein